MASVPRRAQDQGTPAPPREVPRRVPVCVCTSLPCSRPSRSSPARSSPSPPRRRRPCRRPQLQGDRYVLGQQEPARRHVLLRPQV